MWSSMRKWFWLAPALFLVAVATPLAHAPFEAVAVGPIVVNTTDDELNTDGDCSLREAIQAANTDAVVDACATGIGTDTIVLQAGLTYTLGIASTSEDANANGDLDITDTDGLTIETDVPGSTATIDADAIDQVIDMRAGPLTLVDLIVEGGDAGAATGGGIRAVDGDFTLTRCTVRDNTTSGSGGGIDARYDLTGGTGTLTITESTISGNTSGNGGGILFASGSNLLVDI